MKKTIIIITGGLFLLLLVGIWAYLFFVGTPESVDDVFSDFNFGDEAAPAAAPNDESPENATEDTNTNDTTPTRNPLSQLTTTPIAGFTFLATNATSTATELMYVEQGTGHVYHYHLTEQQRTRVSNQTVPTTRSAYIDQEGLYAVLETPDQLQVIALGETASSSAATLPGTYHNLHLTSNDEIYYTQTDTEGTTAYRYDIGTGTTAEVFFAPLQDIRVLWNTRGGPHHLYNTTAATLPSHLYRVEGNTLRRTPITGTSLEVMYGPEDNSFIYTTQTDQNQPRSTYWTPDSEQLLTGFLRPEKCTVFSDHAWCAFAFSDDTNVTEWYRGTHSFSDSFWAADVNSGSSQLLVDFANTSGREIDVDLLQVSDGTGVFGFRNKRDGYLWTYTIN